MESEGKRGHGEGKVMEKRVGDEGKGGEVGG